MQSRARVLILDEPTSALDAQAEEDIFTTLENLPRDKTVILISHRFSTVRRADRIIVLDNGTILEQGSHDELMALGGTYARLFSLQVDRYTVA
jgi:ABC-type multidrug transport system fused ATPase/permease subunit